MRIPRSLLPASLLALALACGGSDKPVAQAPSTTAPAATGLDYVDPSSTGWRLLKDPSSTGTRIVLNLVGPAGLLSRGAGFNLQLPAGLRPGTFAANANDPHPTLLPLQDTGVYELLNTDLTGDPLEPVLLGGGLKKGNLLTVGIFQKDRRATAKDSGQPLCRIALEFNAAAGLKAGDTLSLVIPKSKYMAEDIGAFSIHPTDEMAAKAQLVPMTIALGTLRAH